MSYVDISVIDISCQEFSALSGLPMSNEARLRRDGAISYLQKSNLEDLDILLQAIDYALLLPRDDEFSQTAFLPNLPGQS